MSIVSAAGLFIAFVSILRQFVILPIVIWAYSEVIFVWGTQWQNMILNTIAVLFLYVLNKVCFNVLLVEQTRVEVREFGLAQLTNADKRSINLSK